MINVAVIEDNAAYRQTLSIILQLDESLRLIHKLHNCNTMLQRFTEETPDVVIMDIDLPGISGIQGVWKLKQLWPDMKVLMLTMFEEEEKWSWEKTIEATRSDTLEWGDEKESEESVNESAIREE